MRLQIQYNNITEKDRAAWSEFVANHPENTSIPVT